MSMLFSYVAGVATMLAVYINNGWVALAILALLAASVAKYNDY